MSYQQNRRNQTHEYTADNVAREDRKRSRPSENDCQYPEKRVRIIAAEEPSSTGKLVPSIEVQPDPFGTIEVQPSNAKQVFDTELDTYAQIPKESIQKSTTEEPSNSGASLPLGNTDRSPKGTIDIQSIKAKRTPEPELQSEAEEVNNKIDGNTLDSSKKAGTMDSFEKMNSGQDRGRALYGDMVDTTIGCICFFIYGAELFRMDKDDPKYGTAVRVYLALVFPLVFLFPAVVTKNLWMSRLGMISVASALGYLNLAEWPYEGECEITRMMQGQILMVVLTNLSLSFVEKVLRLVFLFGVGTYVSIQSPFSVYFEDTLPILGGTVLMAFFGLYVFHFGIGRQLATVQGSQLVLASLFVYYTLMDMSLSMDSMSLSAYINLSSYLKAVVLACLGLIATSTFQQEIKHKEQLEVLVSERTKKIQDQNKKLRMVSMALQASETAIAITNGAGIIIWINAAFEHLCQKKEEVLIDIPLNDAFSNLDPARKDENEYTLFRAFQDHTNPSENELQIRESIFRLEVTPFDAEDENHSKSKDDSHREINDRFLVVFKNITSGRARELAEQKAHDKAMMAKAMGDAMVTLTHELRTPLQGIMGVTSLLLQQATDLNHDMLESLKLIMASSSLLLNLINNLLDIKKVTAKMMEEFPMTSVVASGPIKDAVGFCQPLASVSSVKISTDLGIAKHAIVTSNAIRLQQILINLISNAIKFTTAGSEITVNVFSSTVGDAEQAASSALASSSTTRYLETEEGGDDVQELSSPVLVFSVSDCGLGIAPDQAGRLFHRFAQLDTQPQRNLGGNVGQPSGTGLGLNLCKLFVERMSGRIWARNNSDSKNDAVGSTFYFYLPLVSIEQDHNDHIIGLPAAIATTKRRNSITSENLRRTSITSAQKDHISLSECRVLLVDDILINRKVLLRMLKSIGVPHAVTAESGEKALRELAANQYDLVITDLQMPGMSGTELSIAINTEYGDSTSAQLSDNSPPIVVGLTADTGIDVVERCAASGMADILYKPLTLVEMKEYFETTIPRLEAGVWYADVYDAQKDRLLAQ